MDRTVKVGDHSVDIDQFITFLSVKIKQTEEFVEKLVLLGALTLSEIEENFSIANIKDPRDDEDVLGNGVLFDARNNTLDNPESVELFHTMFQKKILGFSQGPNGDLDLDQKQCIVWISDIDKALSVVQSLCHITQGPGPHRKIQAEKIRPYIGT